MLQYWNTGERIFQAGLSDTLGNQCFVSHVGHVAIELDLIPGNGAGVSDL